MMEKQTQDSRVEESGVEVAVERPAYEAPRVTVMDEADVLKTFQFTSAATSWWVM
jgi:hypothetical protein